MPQVSLADIAPSPDSSGSSSSVVVIVLIVVIVLAIAVLGIWLVRRSRRSGGRSGPTNPQP